MVSGIRQTLEGFIKFRRSYGLLAAAEYVFDGLRIGRAKRAERFDECDGTITAGKVYAWQLSDGKAVIPGEVYPYEAAPAWLVRKVIRSLPIDPPMFAFVDLGSGKGRTLLVAS